MSTNNRRQNKSFSVKINIRESNTTSFDVLFRACDVMERIGGPGLDPYYSLIEGGRNGWLFHEMEDLFYYMQILTQGEDTATSRVVSNKIKIAQLPDLMRACGFYPTEFEVMYHLFE